MTLRSANGNGLGVRSIKSNGFVRNVFMHTTATPGVGDGLTNPNPLAGYALIQLKQNFNVYLGGFSGFVSPTTGSALTSVTNHTPYIIGSQVSIRSGVFANGASDGGNGVLFYVEGFTSQVEVTGMPTMSGTVDKIYTLPNAAQGAFRFTSPPTSTGITPTNASTGDAYQLSAAATINIGAHERIFVNTSATQITTIASNHTVGKRIRIVAWSGTIVFATGGNLSLGSNASPFTLASGAMAEFEMWDTIGTWILVGHS